MYRRALDYRTYFLNNQSQVLYSSVARRISETTIRMELQLKSQVLDHTYPIKILSFLSAFKITFDENGIHESSKMRLFQYLFKKKTKAAISARTATVDRKRRATDWKFPKYDMVVNYLLHTYAMDDIIAETMLSSIVQNKAK